MSTMPTCVIDGCDRDAAFKVTGPYMNGSDWFLEAPLCVEHTKEQEAMSSDRLSTLSSVTLDKCLNNQTSQG